MRSYRDCICPMLTGCALPYCVAAKLLDFKAGDICFWKGRRSDHCIPPKRSTKLGASNASPLLLYWVDLVLIFPKSQACTRSCDHPRGMGLLFSVTRWISPMPHERRSKSKIHTRIIYKSTRKSQRLSQTTLRFNPDSDIMGYFFPFTWEGNKCLWLSG